MEEVLRKVVGDFDPGLRVVSIVPLTPDASLRRYYRLMMDQEFDSLGQDSIVAMVFDSVASPEAGGENAIRCDDAYVELTKVFETAGVTVPKLICDKRDLNVLLIEDLGDRSLAQVLIAGSKKEEIENLYCKAVDEIVKIQSISPAKAGIAGKRAFTEKVYISELQEFIDFLLVPNKAESDVITLCHDVFANLAVQLGNFQKVLVHRDFHSWNLMVDKTNNIRVIDFQDALLGTHAYDLVGLLNDRDTDSALGREVYDKLLHYFYDRLGKPKSFFNDYDLVLLQRDLKVAGRFAKLAATRNLSAYTKWIPGTLRRIGSSLARLSQERATAPGYKELLARLRTIFAEINQGAIQPETYSRY